jgi:hypothetical protein
MEHSSVKMLDKISKYLGQLLGSPVTFEEANLPASRSRIVNFHLTHFSLSAH